MQMPDIRLEGISKRWGDVVGVEDLDLIIPDGSFTCLLGPSGCGKTTTLRMIAGLEEPTAGRISMDQQIVYCSERAFSLPPVKRKVGLIFQSYALWPHMTVYQNIAFGLEMQKRGKDEINSLVKQAAEWMRIDELLDRYPSELSGGQQQRVALARSLAPQPDCLLMDEPLSNLDAKLRIEMRTELKRIHAETKMTIVYVTHDQLEAMTMATQVAVMSEGKLQQLAEPLMLYHYPANLFVAEFVGNPPINTMPGRVVLEHANAVACGDFRIPLDNSQGLRDGEDVVVAVRAEDVLVSRPAEPDSIEFTVYSVLPTGGETLIRLRRGDIFMTAKIDGSIRMDIDSSVGISFRTERLLVYSKDTGQLLQAVPEEHGIWA